LEDTRVTRIGQSGGSSARRQLRIFQFAGRLDVMTPPPNPGFIFETINAFQRTAAIRAAIELDLFTAVGEKHQTHEALAHHCNASPRGVRILADHLVVMGLLTKTADGYGLTPDSAAFLDRRSPAFMGSVVHFLVTPTLKSAFDHLTQAVRLGGTALPAEGTVSHDNPVWVEFARSMAALMAHPAALLAERVDQTADRPLKILDIAAGHGLFGLAFARRNPQAAVTALDWPAVLEVAAENAFHAGLSEQFTRLPGSAFEVDLGTGYDIVLLTNFLHHFDGATCETLLSRIRPTLAPGGKVVTLEFIPDAGRVSPPMHATFSLVMLATTKSGDAYTFEEFEQMFRAAGFSRSVLHELGPGMQRYVVSEV
jgi:hypothetical protein